MVFVLLLAGVEKLVNLALGSDQITKMGLENLAGKVLRIYIEIPEINLDVVFTEDRIRFEPVSAETIFEEKNSSSYITKNSADCSIHVENPVELLNLIRSPEGNLPIDGDYKVLMQVRELMASFDPNIASQLEPFIGAAFASQLAFVLNHLKGSVADKAKDKFNGVADWANDLTGYGQPNPEDKAEVNNLRQQLLQLRADIEREQAKLDAIKAEQAALKQAETASE